MNKKSFYEEKLLWRLQRNKLSSSDKLVFTGLHDSIKQYLLEYAGIETIPVIVFWNGKELWTFISGLEIVSMHSGLVHRIHLDDINKKIKVPSLVKQGKESKMTFNYLDLGDEGIRVWAPEGKEMFVLMNLLQMFPLLNNQIT